MEKEIKTREEIESILKGVYVSFKKCPDSNLVSCGINYLGNGVIYTRPFVLKKCNINEDFKIHMMDGENGFGEGYYE
jgi:hypothetical protein